VLALVATTAGSDLIPEVAAARLPAPIAAAVMDQTDVVRLLPGPAEGSPAVPAYAYPSPPPAPSATLRATAPGG
jgi:hypothetical protein